MDKQTLIQTFLSIPAFDKKYWESDLRQTIEDFIFDIIESDVVDDITDLKIPDEPIKLSLYYHWKALNTIPSSEIFELMKKAADLGNPYAMIKIADMSDDEMDKKKYIKLASEAGSPEGILRYIVEYIKEEYKVVELDELNDVDKPLLPEFERKILTDLSRMPKISSSNRQPGEYEYLNELYSHVYTFLYTKTSGDKFLDRFMYYRLEGGFLGGNGLNNHRDDVRKVIKRNYLKNQRIHKLEDENTELKKAYNELKKVKQMDFNDIVSNGVGNYLCNS